MTTCAWRRMQDLRDAYLYLTRIHDAPCNKRAQILWRRMTAWGVSNDLNQMIRSLAVAVRDGRQLVILPSKKRNRADVLNSTGVRLTVKKPWHWLGPGLSLGSVLHLSSCQRLLQVAEPAALDSMGYSLSDAAVAASRLGLAVANRSRDHDMHNRCTTPSPTQESSSEASAAALASCVTCMAQSRPNHDPCALSCTNHALPAWNLAGGMWT